MPRLRWRRGQSKDDPFPEFTRFLRGELTAKTIVEEHRGWAFTWAGVVATLTVTAVSTSGRAAVVSLIFAAVIFAVLTKFVSLPWGRGAKSRIATFVAAAALYACLVLFVIVPLSDFVLAGLVVSGTTPKSPAAPISEVEPPPSMTALPSGFGSISPAPTQTPAPTPTPTPSPTPTPGASLAPRQREIEDAIAQANSLWIAVVSKLGQPDGYTSSRARTKLGERWADQALEYLIDMANRYLDRDRRWYFGTDTTVEATPGVAIETRPGVWEIEVHEVRHLVTKRLSGEGVSASETDCIVEVTDERTERLPYEVTHGRGAGGSLIVQGIGTRVDSRTRSYPEPRC